MQWVWTACHLCFSSKFYFLQVLWCWSDKHSIGCSAKGSDIFLSLHIRQISIVKIIFKKTQWALPVIKKTICLYSLESVLLKERGKLGGRWTEAVDLGWGSRGDKTSSVHEFPSLSARPPPHPPISRGGGGRGERRNPLFQ